MIMILGGFIFSTYTAAFDSFQRTTAQRWAAKNRVRKRAMHQHLGPANDDFKFPGTLYPETDAQAPSIEILRGMADAGVPYILISGDGWVFGEYIILDVADTRSFFLKDGSALKIEFNLTVRRYEE